MRGAYNNSHPACWWHAEYLMTPLIHNFKAWNSVCLASKWLMFILGLIFATLHRKWSLLIYEKVRYSRNGHKAIDDQSITKARPSVLRYFDFNYVSLAMVKDYFH